MKQIDRLLDIIKFLRTDPKGCPWTKEQTHASLIPSLVEETYETAEVIDAGHTDDKLRDELGDILLQVVFHAQMASERGAFNFDDVAGAMAAKLTRRYPTILGNEPNTLKTADEIDRKWDEIKAKERGGGSALDGVSHALPALIRAMKLKGRASKQGWEWNDETQIRDKIAEEIGELYEELDKPVIDKTRAANELGDCLTILANLGYWHGIDAEDSLRIANGTFEKRYRYMEEGLIARGTSVKDATHDERWALWVEAKRLEKS